MKRSDLPVTKVTINLFEGDFGRLRDLHPRLGGSLVIRNLVRQYLKRVEETHAQRGVPTAFTFDPNMIEVIDETPQ